MTSSTLRRWAASGHDTMLTWGADVPDEMCAALIDDTRHEVSDWLVSMLAAEQIAVSLEILSRTVQAIVNEHRAVDPAAVRRWSGGRGR